MIILNLFTESMDKAENKSVVLLFLVYIVVVVCAVGIDTSGEDQSNETEEVREQKEENNNNEELESDSVDPIAEKMEDMTLDEKIGQLFISGIDGTEMTDETAAMIEDNALGGVIL